jgi:uncharacterized membrane protein
MMERYIFASILFFILDMIYVKINERMLHNQIINVQRVVIQPKYPAIIITYFLLFFTICYYIIRLHRDINEAFLLGFLIYGIFEFTNTSIFKKWEWMTAIMNTLWGGIIFALTTQGTYFYFSR